MSDGAEFTVRLVNQVMAPSKAIQKQMRDIRGAFGDTKRVLEAPSPKRGAVSDWQKMVSKARLSQMKDFSKSHAAAMKVPAPTPSGGGGLLDTVAGVAGGNFVVDAVKAVAGATLGAITGVARLGEQFVETGLRAGAFAESSTKAIGYLTDNALHAGTVFDSVRHLAQELGLGVEDTVHSFQRLLAAQFTVGESKELIKMGADLRAINASAEEVQGVLLAITQIKSKGRLQAQEMLQLQERGLSAELVYAALGKTLGKTRAEVMKLQTAGKIGGDVAIEAIKSAIVFKTHEDKLGDVGKNRADTQLQGMLDKLMAGIENFWIDVGTKMTPGATRVANLIAGTIGRLADDPKVAGLGAFMLAKFEKFTNWLQAKWPQIEATVVGGLYLVADSIKFVTQLLESSKPTWMAIGALMAGMAGIAAVLAASILVIGVVAAAAAGAVMAVGFAIGFGLAFITDNVIKWYRAGKALIDALIDGILAGLGPLGNALSGVAAIVSVISSVVHLAAPVEWPDGPKQTDRVFKPIAIAPDPEAAGLPAANNISGANAALSAGSGSNKTEAGNEAGGNRVHIGNLNIPVTANPGDDPTEFGAKVGAAVRAEVSKILKG